MTSYCPSAAINCAAKCWFCVPFVFQGVSNFCSDTLFKLQNITLVIKGVYYCGATRATRFPVSVIIDDLYFKISWRVSTSLKARQFGRIQWDSFGENWHPYSAVIKKLYASKEVKEIALASEGKSCRPENNNYSQSIYMSRPLRVKHAAKITFAQYKCRTFQSTICPADKNDSIGISSILA